MDGERKPNFWRRLSVMRKAQIIGAVSGALLTWGVIELATHHDPQNCDVATQAMLTIPLMIPDLICKALHVSVYQLKNGGGKELSMSGFCFFVLINALLFFFLGSLVGWFIKDIKNT